MPNDFGDKDYKMVQKNEPNHAAYSWTILEKVIEMETAKTERKIQQKLIEMGWTPPKESTRESEL